MRRAGAVAGILIVVVLVFLYRFNTLGGSRGGFPDDHFINLARANQLLDGDWPLRDYSDGSLQGMWPPLSYLASAGAQVVVGRTLLAEALLTSGAIAVAAGITMAAGAHLTGAVALGAAAALLSVIPAVKTYGYARPLLFSTVLLLLFRYIDRPMARTLLPLSASLSVAFLFRHDYALYLASGVTAALLTMPAASPMFAVRRLLLCGSISIALLVPTLIDVQALVGLDSYLQTALAVVQDETARTDLDWPVLDPGSGWTIENTVAWSYYLFLVLPVAATLVAGWRRRYASAPESELPKVLAAAVAGMVANYFLLRGTLVARLADPAVLHAVAGAWLLKVVWSGSIRQTLGRPLRTAAAVTMTAVMAVSAATLGTVGSLPQVIVTSRFTEGVSATFERTGYIWNILAALPPTDWEDEDLTDGYMAAAAYLSQCTPPAARILNATYATDHLVFARRGFAAGQVNFVPGFYSSPDDQRNAVARARRQAPPVVITDLLETYEEDFTPDFPIVHEYLRERYIEAGTILDHGEPYLRVLVERSLRPTGIFRDTELPCFR